MNPDQHFPAGAAPDQVLAATHTWRCILRQATAYLSGLADASEDRATRAALGDTITHLNQACALLTRLQRCPRPAADHPAQTSPPDHVLS